MDIFKNFGEFFWNFWEFLENFLEDFFGVMFLEKILGGFYWDKFFWRNFLGGIFGGGIFWEEIFGRNSLFTLLKLFEYERDWFVCQDFGFCQDFVWKHKEGRIWIFRSVWVSFIVLLRCMYQLFSWWTVAFSVRSSSTVEHGRKINKI